MKMTPEAIRDSIHLKDGVMVWKERTPDFYKQNFARGYSHEGAAANWNIKTAGHPPAWRFSKALQDFTCTMCKQVVPLRDVADALGVPYADAKKQATSMATSKKTAAAKEAVRTCVELRDGKPHWKVRSAGDFPKTAAADLVDFNSKYAGKPIRTRSDGTYRVRFYYVTLQQIKEWLK